MRSCPNCGAALPEGCVLCPHCGAPVFEKTTPPSPASFTAPAAPGADPFPPAPAHPQYEPPRYDYNPQPGPRYAAETEAEPDGGLSTAQYFWTLVLFAVPVVGLIFMVYWGFFGRCTPARKRLARAALIKTGVFALFGLVAVIVLAVFLFSQLHTLQHAVDFYFSSPYSDYYSSPYYDEFMDEFGDYYEDYYFEENPRFSDFSL